MDDYFLYNLLKDRNLDRNLDKTLYRGHLFFDYLLDF